MIFLLGAFSAGLVALMCLPAFWRRAMRLSRRRLEMQMPVSMAAVAADRDLLRAEFAADRRRLEQRMEAQADAQAGDMVELGRRATEIVELQNVLAALRAEHADLTARHAVTSRDLAETLGERGAFMTELHDSTMLADALRDRLRAMTDAHEQVSATAEDRRVAIVGLETKAEGLGARIEGLLGEVEAHARTARNEEARAQGLLEEREILLKEMRSVEQLMNATQERFESERARADGLQQKLEEARREVDAALAAQRQAQKERDAAEAARAAGVEELQAASDRLAQAEAGRHAAEKSAADRLEAMRAEIAALRGALEAAREARGGAARNGAIPDAAQLREAIVDIGAKVAELAKREARPGA